jgi:hypothetical protein
MRQPANGDLLSTRGCASGPLDALRAEWRTRRLRAQSAARAPPKTDETEQTDREQRQHSGLGHLTQRPADLSAGCRLTHVSLRPSTRRLAPPVPLASIPSNRASVTAASIIGRTYQSLPGVHPCASRFDEI